MILIETGEQTERAFMQAAVFADQLSAAGFEPMIDGANIPDDVRSSPMFHALPFLRNLDDTDVSGVVVLGAETHNPDALNRLRRLKLTSSAQVMAFGHFETAQDEISAISRLTYATGRTPKMTSFADHPGLSAGTSICPCFGVEIPVVDMPHLRSKPGVTIIVSDIEDPAALNGLQFLTTSRAFNALVYMSGRQKSDWLKTYPPGGHIYGISEISPTALTKMAQVLVLTGPIGNNQNALCLLNNHLVSGSAIVDATPNASFEAAGLPVHRGPSELAYLQMYLSETIFPNIEGIVKVNQARGTPLGHPLKQFFQDYPELRVAKPRKRRFKQTAHFMPTNGNGLGHAQRCVLVAEAMTKHKLRSSFFAFPSCLPMINRAGFTGTPLVPRSSDHLATEANDLANYARLRSKVAKNDILVFDGGYVFDSVVRSSVEHNLRSVWIRRGLWRTSQDNRIPMDREKYFSKVIVPKEGLEELNVGLSAGSHIDAVGPIVRQEKTTAASNKSLRASLSKQFGLDFKTLIVTMLGSGASHDLSANVATVCNAVEHRDDCLNLIVVWPSAVVPSERYAWTRSKVVKTLQASWIAAHADFVVTAAGYNSFHEALYNKVPAIFIPQEAQILDDQEMRAEAAAKLGIAAHVPAGKLSGLDRELRLFIDGGKAQEIRKALATEDLPKPGNQDAADLIAEMAHD